MKHKPSLFLKDIVEITKIFFEILIDGKNAIDNFPSFYDSYRTLDQVLYTGKNKLICGVFTEDSSIFHGTESFESPLKKWIYYSNQNIQEFNDTIQKYLRTLPWFLVSNQRLSKLAQAQQFKANMRVMIPYIVSTIDEGKIHIQPDGKTIQYEYYQYVYQSLSSWRVAEDECFQKISFDIFTPDHKNQIIENAKNALDELQTYKERFERLMLEYCTVKSFFVENIGDKKGSNE